MKGEFSQPEWIGCMGHSSWTICSPLSQFCFPNFPTFSLSSWETNSYYPREGKAENGKGEFSQPEWIGCLGHSSWTICSPLSQFCFLNLTTFSLSYWEANSYYPREGKVENGKGEFFQPVWIGCLGHSTWIICGPLSQLCFPNFLTFPLSRLEANSYYPREGKAENG